MHVLTAQRLADAAGDTQLKLHAYRAIIAGITKLISEDSKDIASPTFDDERSDQAAGVAEDADQTDGTKAPDQSGGAKAKDAAAKAQAADAAKAKSVAATHRRAG